LKNSFGRAIIDFMKYFIASFKERKKNRLPNFDYSQDGWYFVTICIKNKDEFFGHVKNENMILNELGEIANQCWREIPNHFPNVILDEYAIMPNHIHGIVVIENNVGNKDFCSDPKNDNAGNKDFCSLHEMPWQTKLSRSLPSIIRGFKIGVAKWCRKNNREEFQWQKSFYDHIIRSEKSLDNIRQYIIDNPLKWKLDRNNKENLYY
jgi:REP element-mobilizing transposase RayT